MVKGARAALLAVTLFGATVAAAEQTGRMSPADNEASAMGNCFDRRLGVSRSAMDGPVSSRPTSSSDSGSSSPSPAPPSSNAGASDAAAAPATAANSASPSSLPDCK